MDWAQLVATKPLRPEVPTVRSTGEQWQAFYRDRVTLAIERGCRSHAAAEEEAFEECVRFWLHSKGLQPGDPDRCAFCLRSIGRIGEDSVPVLNGGDGHLWLHHACLGPFSGGLTKEAKEALSSMGLGPCAPDPASDGY